MTYLEYLLFFIILPSLCIFGSSFILRKNYQKKNSIIANVVSFSILSLIALIYTTPWDNYLVANGIWYYDSGKILGIILGNVPFEEYSYFILETLLVSLIVTVAIQLDFIKFPETISFNLTKSKFIILSILSIAWIICFLSFFNRFHSMLYMNLLLLWGIPPIFFQTLIGWDLIRYNKKTITLAILILGSYLSVTDFIAINQGIWTINPSFTVGIVFLMLPLEEVMFFFITVILIIFGYIQFWFYIEHYFTVKASIYKGNSDN